MGVGARTGADGQHGPAGATSSGSSQFPQPPRGSQGQSATARSTDGLRSPCDRQPHCANWRRHENDSKLGMEKKLQYLFLYAAEARSLTCMRRYVEVAHVDPGCRLCQKTARDWAAKTNKALPPDVEGFFQSHGL